MARRGKIVRVLFDTRQKLPAHVQSCVSAVSPSSLPLTLLGMEGDEGQKLFGLMEMRVGGRAQRVPGQMAFIAAPGGVDLYGLDKWMPGETLEMKLQHVIMNRRGYDSESNFGGMRRFRAVIIAREPDIIDEELALAEPRTILEPIAIAHEDGEPLFDVIADVKVS